MISERYAEFIEAKGRDGGKSGFEPTWWPDSLKPHQRFLVDWAVRQGRAAVFADCGLGKSPIELAWAENVVRHTNRPVLHLTPLAVAAQMLTEAEKFGVEAARSTDGKVSPGAKVVIANIERVHLFDPADFSGLVLDESSILKNIDGARREELIRFMRSLPYRLLATATAAPNDYHEVGSSSEALGYLGARDMLTKFFKDEAAKDFLGWGRKTYRFRGHAAEPFWRWVCSWARACRKPSDLGFPDDGYNLPPLIEREHVLKSSVLREGMLFALPARGIKEQRAERRASLGERCQAAAENVTAHDGPSVIWCHLNAEGDRLEKMVDGGVQVSGSMSDEEKEERLVGFASGQVKRIIIKPKIGCLGLNWQHCRNVVTFPSHSFEQYYQAVRRCWRFGQTEPVTVTVIASEGEAGVTASLKRKAEQADAMFASLVAHMAGAMRIDPGFKFDRKEQLPSWL